MKRLALPVLLLFLAALPARADRFIVSFAAAFTYADQNGKLKTTPQSKRATIQLVIGPGGNPSDYEIVYDTVADNVVIVSKADGSTKGIPLAFSGGNMAQNIDDTKRQRVALATLNGVAKASGSAFGPITIKRDKDGNLTKFLWTGAFVAGVDSTVLTPEGVVKGKFRTGRKFEVTPAMMQNSPLP